VKESEQTYFNNLIEYFSCRKKYSKQLIGQSVYFALPVKKDFRVSLFYELS